MAQGISAAPQLMDYQGYLEDGNGNPITDTVSMTFTIYTASSGGTSKWTETQGSVEILGGLFNVTLGSSTAIPDTVFNEDARWLATAIGGGSELSPRTRIVSTAYAHRVNTVDGASGGTIDGQVTADKGNFGDDNTNGGTYAFVAGEDNVASGNWATVGGGLNDTASGAEATIAGGKHNIASGANATVGGGYQNVAADTRVTVSGGGLNTANHRGSTISGGESNYTDSMWATVGGGKYDTVSGVCATVSGGQKNKASGYFSTVSGGDDNTASGNAATVGGGSDNTASGGSSTVSGGTDNTASGSLAAVPGGSENAAKGYCSLAAGRRAKANHNGTIVLAANASSDPFPADSIRSGGISQIVLKADSGIYITNTAGLAAYNPARVINTSTGAYLSSGGTWTNASDKNLKENFSPIDGNEILQKLDELPIVSWNYKADRDRVKHIGPVAQDFYRLFGLGDDDKTISTVDPAGIALAAIQQLYRNQQELQRKSDEIDQLKVQVRQLEALVMTVLAEQRNSASGRTGKSLSVLPAVDESMPGSAGK